MKKLKRWLVNKILRFLELDTFKNHVNDANGQQNLEISELKKDNYILTSRLNELTSRLGNLEVSILRLTDSLNLKEDKVPLDDLINYIEKGIRNKQRSKSK